MNIQLAFVYDVEMWTGPGDRVDRRFTETFEFPVRQLSADECPVVMRHLGFVGRLRTEERSVIDVILHEGSLYEPLRTQARYPETGVVTVRQDDESVLSIIRNEFGNKFPLVGADTVKLKGPPRADRVIHSKRDEALKVMEKIAASVVSVGGEILIKVEEPVLVAGEGYVRLMNGLSAIEHAELPNTFRLDELVSATQRAAILNGKGRGAPVAMPEYELLDASWLAHRLTDVHTAIGLAAFEEAVAHSVARLPVPALVSYGRFRNAIGGWRGAYRSTDEQKVRFEEVLDRAARLIDNLPAEELHLNTDAARDLIERSRLAVGQGFDEELDEFINDSGPSRYRA